MSSGKGRMDNMIDAPAASLMDVTAWQDEALATSSRRQPLHKERSGGDAQLITTQQMALDGPEQWRRRSREADHAGGWCTRPTEGDGPTPGSSDGHRFGSKRAITPPGNDGEFRTLWDRTPGAQ
jgi:hypothetical protein